MVAGRVRIAVVAAVAGSVVAAGGCATIVKGTTQQVSIVTPNAPGAECTLVSDGIGSKVVTTPATVVLDKSQHSIAVTCKKRCFQDGTGIIASHTEAMAAGNIVAGGIIGLGVDAASGAMNRYTAENQIAMVPVAGCKA
jgi:hypothetical protein